MTYACLMLPRPPSLNNLFVNNRRTGGRFTSKTYAAWQAEAGHALVQQRPLPRFDGPVSVTVGIGRPDRRKRDLDNVGAKAVLDLLVKHGVLADDSLIQRITMEWVEDVTGARVELEAAE